MSAMDKRKIWRRVNGTTNEVTMGTMRFLRIIKLKLRSKRGRKETVVKDIHIVPEDDNERWACRSASSSCRASSSTTNCSNLSDNTDVHVVHDMNDEYHLEYR